MWDIIDNLQPDLPPPAERIPAALKELESLRDDFRVAAKHFGACGGMRSLFPGNRQRAQTYCDDVKLVGSAIRAIQMGDLLSARNDLSSREELFGLAAIYHGSLRDRFPSLLFKGRNSTRAKEEMGYALRLGHVKALLAP